MNESPETRYVAVGDADVAYQVAGDGPVDVLYFYGLGSHIEVLRHTPGFEAFLDRLTHYARVILFDRRGTGASDSVPRDAIPTFEAWTDDVLAVLDAAGSERAVIIAALDAGPVAMLFAAHHPERVQGLLLLNTAARFLVDDDYPIGASADNVDALVTLLRDTWGTVDFVRAANPGMEDPYFLEHTARWSRLAATRRTAAAQFDYILTKLDVRQVLPSVQTPTRVLHVEESGIVPIEHGRYLAEHIEGARFVALPGGSLSMSPLLTAVADETIELVTGERPTFEIERVLTTMLFTDIVGSTQRAATIGDRRWRSVLDAHDRTIRAELARHRGREVETAGDGFFASFDGPARGIRCAQAIVEAVGTLGINVRAGLHTGEVEIRGEHLGGLAVHIAARVGALAGPREVLVSGTVKDLVVGSGIEFTTRGERELKGVPGTWKVFALEG